MSEDAKKITDTIPRASIAQIIGALGHIAQATTADFDSVRQFLYAQSGRRAPASATALWTVARDVLTELQRLELAKVGTLPRRRSDVDRLGKSPCEATPAGQELAELSTTKLGQSYDKLLIAWLNSHPYFRSLTSRIFVEPLYVPDVTSATQVGGSRDPAKLAGHVVKNCLDRLAAIDFPSPKAEAFRESFEKRASGVAATLASPDLDSKKLVDLVQDSMVLPAFLEAENLTFDHVTFQHLLRIAGDFLVAASATSHPNFDGKTVFSTCDFTPDSIGDPNVQIESVQHHGTLFARPLFADALTKAYEQLRGPSGGYADAYKLRAVVCLNLGVQPPVFAACLKDIISAGDSADPVVYTELPFTPPPQGESYVEVGRQRIGRLKIKSTRGV